ncbi:hypothetical protein WA845_02990 [Agrobacterium sp. CMT1]|uniref:hypothetical protein n=1 Tax=Agrobacterium sp. CMT1 TaxID=3128901 RepID=UPI003077DB0D
METEKEYEQRLKSAERQHDWRKKGLEIHATQLQSFAGMAMKAPALVSAGGVAAALGFYSANYNRLKLIPTALDDFNAVLVWLFMSLLFTLVAPGAAYFSQLFYSAAIASEEHFYDRPFVRDTKRSRRFSLAGDVARWIAVGLTAGSAACIVVGGIDFLQLVAKV